MTELRIAWASECHYCWQLLLKTRGVRAQVVALVGFQASPREIRHMWMSQVDAVWSCFHGFSPIPGRMLVQSISLFPQLFLVEKLFQTWDATSAVWKRHNLTSRIPKINKRSENVTCCYFIICTPPWLVTAKTPGGSSPEQG